MNHLRERLTYDEFQQAIARERSAWTQYQTVRDAMALGFWPDAYGNVEDDTSILCPPTQFYYPRAGVAYPEHAHGVAAGSDLLIFTHAKSTPDELRDQACWIACIHSMRGVLWEMQRQEWRIPKTFDEALAFAVAMGDEVRRQYIVPDYDEETRHASLPVRHWRELVAIELPERVESRGLQQLAMFEAPKPRAKSRIEAAQDAIKAALARLELGEDASVQFELPAYDVQDLADRANNARERRQVDAA